MYGLIAFIVYSPMVTAACEIEHFASLARSADQIEITAPAATPATDPTTDEHDPCCADDAPVLMSQSRVASMDGASLASFGIQIPAQVALHVVVPSRPVSRSFTGFRPPPPEPVFRRVPKLLF